jgi:hypothetical protein
MNIDFLGIYVCTAKKTCVIHIFVQKKIKLHYKNSDCIHLDFSELHYRMAE